MGIRSLSLGLALAAAGAIQARAQAPAPVVAPVTTQDSIRATSQGISDQMNDKAMGKQKQDEDDKKGQEAKPGDGDKK